MQGPRDFTHAPRAAVQGLCGRSWAVVFARTPPRPRRERTPPVLHLAALAFTMQALALAAPKADANPPMWVFFSDKAVEAPALEAALRQQEQALAPRALKRRVRVRGDRGVDARDLPPASQYVDAVRQTGARIRSSSRWL